MITSPQSSFPGAESPGTTVTLSPGSFSVSETGPTGYTQSLSSDCSGTLNAGGNKVCTVINNDNHQTGGASITVNDVRCAGKGDYGEQVLYVQLSFSVPNVIGTFQLQYYSPNGDILRTAQYGIPANYPDPYGASTDALLSLPPGPTAGTYKITMIVNFEYDKPITSLIPRIFGCRPTCNWLRL